MSVWEAIQKLEAENARLREGRDRLRKAIHDLCNLSWPDAFDIDAGDFQGILFDAGILVYAPATEEEMEHFDGDTIMVLAWSDRAPSEED